MDGIVPSSQLNLVRAITQTLSTPFAILDIHFYPFPAGGQRNRQHCLVAATSTGSLALYHLVDQNRKPIDYEPTSAEITPRLVHVKTCQLFPESTIVTSFAWHPAKYDQWCLGVTLTTQEVKQCFLDIDLEKGARAVSSFNGQSDEEDIDAETVHSHDLEAWTLAYSKDGNHVFSGGDDSALKCSSADQLEAGLQWTDKRTHGAGVTAILPLEDARLDSENIIVTGSYDDHIRVIDAPPMGRRTVLIEENLGGGVWRLKRIYIEPSSRSCVQPATAVFFILASCMHAGARILKITKTPQDEWSIEVLAKFEEHKSMNYGSDYKDTSPDHIDILSTSFYDRLLCLWQISKEMLTP